MARILYLAAIADNFGECMMLTAFLPRYRKATLRRARLYACRGRIDRILALL
jgi:hypothetical protein